jgi:hypothetical protein
MIRPNLLVCRCHATYCRKDLDKGYDFALDLISIKGLQQEVMGIQSCGNLNFGNFGIFNLGVSGQNEIWM